MHNHRKPPHSKLTFSLSLLLSSDPLLYGGTDLPHRLLYQWGGRPAVQAAQQHGGRLLVCAVCPLHLLHHSGTAVCRQSLPPWLRSRPCSLLNWNKRLCKFYGIYKNTQRLRIKNNKLWSEVWNREVSYVSRVCGTMEYLTTKRCKQINERNTTGGLGHKRVEECERGQPRLSQHPATVDLKYGRLSVVLMERLLNVPLSRQPWPQCWRTFLEDHYSQSSTWLTAAHPSALSTHLRHHDRSCCYFWLLLAISVVCFSVVVHFVFLFFFSCTPVTLPLKYSECNWGSLNWTLEGYWGILCHFGFRAGFILACRITRPQVCSWGEQLWSQLSGPTHRLLWTKGRCRCATSLSPTSSSSGAGSNKRWCLWAAEQGVKYHNAGECHSM